MSHLPDLEGLALFAKVAEERSFAGAAREFDLSVATVSRAVTRLEGRLGGRLFNRTSRQLALTEFGASLLDQASRMLRDAEELEATAREQAAHPRGLVRLAVPMTFGIKWVAPLLPEFLERFPDISVDLHLSDASVDLIGEGFDAALRIALLPDSSLVARKLCSVSRFLVASPEYLRLNGKPKHPNDLNRHDCVGYAYRSQNDTWKLVDRKGNEELVKPRGKLRVTNIEASIPLLLAGKAVGELPEFIASGYLKRGELQEVLPGWSHATGGLYFVTPTLRSRPAKVEALGNFLGEKLSEPDWRWPPRRPARHA